jgi:uncharacterized protein (UPF0335 family)
MMQIQTHAPSAAAPVRYREVSDGMGGTRHVLVTAVDTPTKGKAKRRAPDPITNACADSAAQELKLLIERVERLEEEKQAIADDIKDVFSEAKSRGYDCKALRALLAIRRLDPHMRQEAEAILETYKAAIGLD